MVSCGQRGCSCDTRHRSKRTPRYTQQFIAGQEETLRRLRKIPGLTITNGPPGKFGAIAYHWLQMGEYKAPAVILHGSVSIQTSFVGGASRSLIPISKYRPDGSELFQAIRDNNVSFALASARYIHES